MAGFDPFELIGRLRHARVEPLVDVLRRLHREGAQNLSSIEELLGKTSPLQAESAASVAEDRATPHIERYEELKRHFVPYAEQLRRQSLLTDQLLHGFLAESRASEPATLQQEIRIQYTPGTPSGARFVVANLLGTTTKLQFRIGRVHGLPLEHQSAIRLRFQPDQPRLDPKEERAVEVSVDVENLPDFPEKVDVGVDVLGDERLLLKLWIRIEIRTPERTRWTGTT